MTPPPESEDAFTYDKPNDKKQFMELICHKLEADVEIPGDGNISADSWSIILEKLIQKTGDNQENGIVEKLNKPALTRRIAEILNIEFLDNHVGKKNGVVSIDFMESVLEVINTFDTPQPIENDEMYEEIGREEPTTMSAMDLCEAYDRGEIQIPRYQRASTMWNSAKKQKLVDSMLRNIPMPTIVLGRINQQEHKHLVDGQQRLTNLMSFLKGEYAWNAGGTSENKTFDQLEDWMKSRIKKYSFVVETVNVPNVTTLAHIYERYNTSGKALNEPQIRVALYHHNSVLHHCLMAMAGGPIPKHDIGVDLTTIGRQAGNIRRMLPNIGQPIDNERERLTQPTEKTYDLLCRLAGYTLYDANTGGTEQPTSKKAVRTVLGIYDGITKHAEECHNTAVEIAKTMEKVDRVFGECAWRKFRPVVDSNDPNLTNWKIGSLNGWAAQIQYAGMWEYRTQERLLTANREQLVGEWIEHYKNNMDGQRQNSKTLWDAQDKWLKRLGKLVVEWAVIDLQSDDSERGRFLREEAETMMVFDEPTRNAILRERKRRFPKHEYEYLKNCISEQMEWRRQNA